MDRFKNVVSVVVLALLLFSCQEFVTPNEDNTLSETQVKNNRDLAEGILLRAYQQLDGLGAPIEAVATDDAVSNNEQNEFRRMATGEWTARFNPMSEWDTSYDAIYQLNQFINEIVDEVEWADQSQYEMQEFPKRLKGEAYGLRAFHELQLLQSHSGISNGELLGYPIVKEALTNDDTYEIPRNSFQESVGQILADADSAIKYLPQKYDAGGQASVVYGARFRGRIDAIAVQGIKSRATLLAASPAFDTIEWEIAAEQAAEVVMTAGGPSGLAEDGDQFWLNENSAEIIWRDDYNTDIVRETNNFPPSFFGEGGVNPSHNLVESFPMANGYPIENASSGYDPNNPYQNRDPRLSKYIIFNGAQFKGQTINTIDGSADGIDQQENSTRTGYYVKKLLDENVSLDPSGGSATRHFNTHMRYTEFFLNYAEAANEAWGPDGDPNGYGFTARDIIHAIRVRAGISQPDQYLNSISAVDDMRELIHNERRLELSFEGKRFWDLRRWNSDISDPAHGVSGTDPIETTTVEERAYQDYMIYAPIPYFEVIKYNELTQNDGW